MKQKIVNYLKIGILVFGISIFLSNCQTDETDELISPKESSEIKKGKLKNYSQLSTYVEKLQNRRSSTTNAKESSLEANNGFDILYDQDMFIQEIGSNTTYSIPIIKNNQPTGTFSNLIVSFSDVEETEAFILNYEPTDEYIDEVYLDEQTPFKGSFISELIDYDGSLDNLKNSNVLDCITVTTKYCDYDEGQHGDIHLGGRDCTPGFYWYVTTTVCYDDKPTLADVPTPGSGDPSATDYITDPSNVSSGGSQGNPENSPVVVPTVPRMSIGLSIDGLSNDMKEWLKNNPFRRAELEQFLNENNWSQEALEEVKLTIQAESIGGAEWDYTRTGVINGKEALTYIAAYDGFDQSEGGGIYTMYKLANGHTLCESTIRRIINPTDGNTLASQDYAAENYYYVKINQIAGATEDDRKDMEGRWYTYRMPPDSTEVDCIYCDIEHLLQTTLTSTLRIVGRYITFTEDGIILITGKDFDNAESSRAVAGTFIVLDFVGADNLIKLVRFLRNADEAVDIAEAVYKYMDEIFKSQKKNVDDVLDGTLDLNEFGNTIRKGNYGEMRTDVNLTSLGYEPQHARITNIDEPLSHGIDGVFKNPQTGEYLIVESKYGTSQLGNTIDGRQMSDAWIEGTITGNSRLVSVVGEELAEDIIATGYKRIVSRILPDGTNYFEILDSAGEIIEIWYP
ncbi:hypothetical protein [Kordia sp.]|uniref:hypothetical protein n=1 Tax=Kordia sp. TaxID=1965332 RepID=UPI003B592BDA